MRSIEELKVFSKRNKNRDVKAEKCFRKALICNRIHYQRQKVIYNYIVDFYLPKRNLIIEIDEEYHNGKKQKKRDLIRQSALEYFGYKVIRFPDVAIFNDIQSCINTLRNETETIEKYRGSKKRLSNINKRSSKQIKGKSKIK